MKMREDEQSSVALDRFCNSRSQVKSLAESDTGVAFHSTVATRRGLARWQGQGAGLVMLQHAHIWISRKTDFGSLLVANVGFPTL